jgi:hypothetical protein
MEEKNKMKVLKPEEDASQEVRKLSYEQLENAAHQLSEQGRQLYLRNQQLEQALQQSDMTNFYKRLDYLWQVLNSTTPYLDEDFKHKCGEEFMALMSKPEQKDDSTEEEPITESK